MSMSRNVAVRNVFALCAAALVAVLVLPCRAAELETGRYQWQIVPREKGNDTIYVIDRETGEVAKVDGSSKKWIPVAPSLDWNSIRKQREEQERQLAEREREWAEARRQQEEVDAKREAAMDAFLKAFSQMSLEEQVATAKDIYVAQKTPNSSSLKYIEDLKVNNNVRTRPAPSRSNVMEKKRPPLPSISDVPDGDIVVQFSGRIDGDSFEFHLSHTAFDNKKIFPAPETIIEDVKAEIKRQAEQQKEGHAENH